MVEGARLESVYTSKGYRGFESLTLRHVEDKYIDYQLLILFYLNRVQKRVQFELKFHYLDSRKRDGRS